MQGARVRYLGLTERAAPRIPGRVKEELRLRLLHRKQHEGTQSADEICLQKFLQTSSDRHQRLRDLRALEVFPGIEAKHVIVWR